MSHIITVRKANSSEASDIAEFNIAMAWETEEKKLSKETIYSGVKSLMDKPEYGFYIVAESDGETVASLMITKEWSDWRNGVFWWIQSVYVKPDFRRQGIYRKMYQTVLKMAENQPDVCGCRLYVEKENITAQKTYEALGMSETHYKMYEGVFGQT
jgi:ribosomal protein S18 acetylase RimI-like enzyme